MLPYALPLTAEAADHWTRAGVPRWVPRVGLTVLWLAVCVAAVSTDNTHCTPDDPSICGPDRAFDAWVVVLVGTPVLLLWMPLLGCIAGVAFAMADLVYDDAGLSRIGFAVHGLACALVAGWLRAAAARQQRIAGEAGGGFAASARSARSDIPWLRSRPLAAAALVLVAAASFAWYGRVTGQERTHVARSQLVDAEIVGRNSDDSTITLLIDDRRRAVDVLDTDDYRTRTTPVLVDPLDPTWLRLVAEPQDPGGWEAGGLGALTLAALLLGRELTRRRAVRRLLTGDHPALLVQVRPYRESDGDLLPAAPAEGPVIGELALQWPPTEPTVDEDDRGEEGWGAAFGRAWRGDDFVEDDSDDGNEVDLELEPPPPDPVPVVLLGALHDRGWVLAVDDDGVRLASSPLRLQRAERVEGPQRPAGPGLLARLPWRGEEPRRAKGPGRPVTADSLRGEPELPLTRRGRARDRALGAAMVVAALAALPWLVNDLAESWYQRGILVLVGGQSVVAGCQRVVQQLRLTRERLEVVGPLRVRSVPWERLHGVRRNGPVLTVAWDDELLELAPFATDQIPSVEAEQIGAAMMTLRERALAAGDPVREVTSWPGPAWPVLVVYVVVAAISVVLV